MEECARSHRYGFGDAPTERTGPRATCRSSDISRSTPIVAISASASVYTREEALAAGCDDFVAKPLRAEELLDSIGRLLRLSWRLIEIHAPKAADAGAKLPGSWWTKPGLRSSMILR